MLGVQVLIETPKISTSLPLYQGKGQDFRVGHYGNPHWYIVEKVLQILLVQYYPSQ